jgi:uncharacterized membrane protein YhaH (DUF805 family)
MTYKPNRINRGTYLNSIAASSVAVVICALLGFILDIIIFNRLRLTLAFGAVSYIAALIYIVIVSIKRLHDINKSGLWLLLFLVLFANFYLFYLVYFKKGDKSSNTYGKAPSGIYVFGASENFFSRKPIN